MVEVEEKAEAMDEEAQADAEEKTEQVRGRKVPNMPTVEEQRDHCKTHIPFRSWCRHCVEARLQNLPH